MGVEIFIQDLSGLFAEVPAFSPAKRGAVSMSMSGSPGGSGINYSVLMDSGAAPGSWRGMGEKQVRGLGAESLSPTWHPGIESAGS